MNRISKVIDLSHRIDGSTPPFPGDPPVELKTIAEIPLSKKSKTQRIHSTQISICAHCGTHMDAPFHFFSSGPSIDEVALKACVGPAVLIWLNVSSGGKILAEHLKLFRGSIRETQRAILNTGWHRRWKKSDYFTDHPVITQEAARFLIDCGIKLVGVDTPSVDQSPYEAHLEFLGNNVLIVENLTNLGAIPSEMFHLVALPLSLSGRDGSPVRAIAII